MGNFTFDVKKAKGTSDATQSDHIERKVIPHNADPTRTHLNMALVTYPDGVNGRDEAIAYRLKTAGIKRKITNDQVRVVRIVMSGTHEDMMTIYKNGKLGEWCQDSIRYLYDTFGWENVVSAHLHMDEKTPHIHASVVPIVTGERRKAKKEQANGKRKYRKKANAVRLCADDLFNRQTLISYHDGYAEVMAKYGLQRGVRGSEARHTTTTQYYRELKKMNDTLEMESKRLQEEKAEAEQELKQVKSEIRTDKLKSVATDAATALASGVSSLFGSGKMKSLERKNEDLRDEIAVRDETIEQLQSNIKQMEVEHQKQIKEVKQSYEAEHRKQSEYIDKILRYFPYVEKLMPMIKYLSEKMGFNDNLIKALCTFKEIPVKGKLYSTMFNQSFSADGAVCSLKEDKEGRFDLRIDGVSHHSWFRRKKDEFMEALGLPTSRRQNRGLKL